MTSFLDMYQQPVCWKAVLVVLATNKREPGWQEESAG
jgi:hypothetical protein